MTFEQYFEEKDYITKVNNSFNDDVYKAVYSVGSNIYALVYSHGCHLVLVSEINYDISTDKDTYVIKEELGSYQTIEEMEGNDYAF